jgi:hypothetical protein
MNHRRGAAMSDGEVEIARLALTLRAPGPLPAHRVTFARWATNAAATTRLELERDDPRLLGP